jgi:hypothetical protein
VPQGGGGFRIKGAIFILKYYFKTGRFLNATCHDFQIEQHLSKKLVICWIKFANFGKLLSKLFTEK